MLGKQVHSSQPEGAMELEQDHGNLRNVIGMIRLEQACIDITLQHAAQSTAHAAIKPVTHDHPGSCLKKVAGLTGGVRRFSRVQLICIKCL